MRTPPTAKQLTAEELLQLTSDRFRYELIEGELRIMEPPGSEHGFVAMRIGVRLANHVENNKLGHVFAAETGFLLRSNPDTVRAPDASFVSQELFDRVGLRKGYWPGAPDLAVEVLSPTDTHPEIERKVRDWLDAGARMVVAVDPVDRSASVYRAAEDIVVIGDDGVLDGADVVPGWRLPLRDVFE